MKEKGVSTYLLREKCGVDSKTIRRLRANDNMEAKTLINYVWRLTAVWKILLNIFQTNSNSSTVLCVQNHRAVSIFGTGCPDCDLAVWTFNAPKMEGASKGGYSPSWHTTFGESLVCYTFCPGWRGKGAARSGADAFQRQEIRRWGGAQQSSHPLDFGRGKRYIKPSSIAHRPAEAL